MLIVLASRWDQQASTLVQNWERTRLLTPDDLSLVGCMYRASRPDETVIVANSQRIRTAELTGVFTRLAHVVPHELLQIAPNDRDYVASEMHAFLLAWLTSLRCPVVNRPSPACLAGPSWSFERWIWEAVKLGIPVIGLERHTAAEPMPLMSPDLALTVIGRTILGASNGPWQAYAARLARAAGVTALTVRFVEGRFQDASPWIDITDASIAEALASHLAEATAP